MREESVKTPTLFGRRSHCYQNYIVHKIFTAYLEVRKRIEKISKMKVAFRFFLSACWLMSCADQASAFATRGIAVPARTSSVLQATPKTNGADEHRHQQQREEPETTTMAFSKTKLGETTKLLGTALLSASLLFGSILTVSPEAASAADSSRVIGQLKGSGLVFKDTLTIERFEDPKVKGVVLYISNFDRPMTEKFSKKNFFNDPSYASVACARTGEKVAIASNINKTPQGEEVFEESRSLLFKTLRVQRVYDEGTK